MVGLWGMSDDLGPVSYGVGESQPFLGRELSAPREYAEATAARIDMSVAALIGSAHERARAILSRERKALDALAAELVAKEMVTAGRLDEILTGAGAKLRPRTLPPGTPAPVVALPPAARPKPKAAAKPARPAAAATRAVREPSPAPRPKGPGSGASG